MKYNALICAIACVSAVSSANAYSNKQFRSEVIDGLDIVAVRSGAPAAMRVEAPGELGRDVYQYTDTVDASDTRMFIPTDMYLRGGAGLNLGFATDKAKYGEEKYETSGSYLVQIGLGWNLSSYVRGEIDFQNETFKFSDLKNVQANYSTLGAMLYFDFARRYVQMGDITYRRRFVPFMGLGAAAGMYKFDGRGGDDGFVGAAPRAVLGFNVMLNELIGVDIAYQYQMMLGNKFGWGLTHSDVTNVSNVIASFRVNF